MTGNTFPYAGAAASAALTPIIMAWLRKSFPPTPLEPGLDIVVFRRRNGWIDNIATLLIFVGLCAAFPVISRMDVLAKNHSFAVALSVLGLAFSMAVLLPIFWVCSVTLPSGMGRLREYFAFYQYRWEVGPVAILITLSPFLAVGIVSLVTLAWLLTVEWITR